MTAYRIRPYGSSEWTEILLEGDLEEFAGAALVGALSECEHLHVQERVEGEWEDVDA